MSRAQVTPLGRGLHRVTLPLPFPPGHVHCYALEGDEGWTLVDAGLGVPDAGELWGEALRELGAESVACLVITHFHPDHIGAAADVADLTGAQVWQNAGDERQPRAVWSDGSPGLAAYLRRHGAPERALAGLDGGSGSIDELVHL